MNTDTEAMSRFVPPLPAIKLIGEVAAESYVAGGRTTMDYFVELGSLTPECTVLDIGCGYGRLALPLLGYLREPGAYRGFDVMPDAIQWCQNTITPIYPRFTFVLSDIDNGFYYTEGKAHDYDYTFPYADKTFDVVFAWSVFTHLLPAGTEQYFREVSRVLKDGGRCLFSWFLRTEESVRLVTAERTTQTFTYDYGVYSSTSEEVPESAVAYDEAYICDLYRRNALAIDNGVRYGSWCERAEYLLYQDLIVATKQAGGPIRAPLHRRSAAAAAVPAPVASPGVDAALAPAAVESTGGVLSPAVIEGLIGELGAARRRAEALAVEKGRLQAELAHARRSLTSRVARRLAQRFPAH